MDQYENYNPPLFHRRLLVFVFTFFLGAFFGSLLFSQNLHQAGKKNFIAGTIIGSLLYNYFALRLPNKRSLLCGVGGERGGGEGRQMGGIAYGAGGESHFFVNHIQRSMNNC